MWYLQALGAAVSLALLAEMNNREKPLLSAEGERVSGWSVQDIGRCRTLWLDCLLYGQLAKRPQNPDIYLHTLAEAAFAAAWTSLSSWDTDVAHRARLQQELTDVANFLQTLKPNRHRPGILELKSRLQRIDTGGPKRAEVWAYVIGHWLQSVSGQKELSDYEEMLELGWPLASFGLNFWEKGETQYRQSGKLQKLIQPFARADAFELFGPFNGPSESGRQLKGARVLFGAVHPTKGMKSPPIWKLEGLFGGTSGVIITRTGHVHRQFPGDDLPEWFDAVEVVYDPKGVALEIILNEYWTKFPSAGDLIFFTEEDQKFRCTQAWETFKAAQPGWAVPGKLNLKPCNWFEMAKPKKQKSALHNLPLLERTFGDLDLCNSHLATKINAFAAGFGTDEDVVLLAARFGLEDGLTLALRTIRYFARWL